MLTATLNPVIRFVVDPDGSIAGATGFNNFFNDGVQFSATIEQQSVPARLSVMLLLSGLIATRLKRLVMHEPRMINSGLLTNTHSG